jgi:hypothetical protein
MAPLCHAGVTVALNSWGQFLKVLGVPTTPACKLSVVSSFVWMAYHSLFWSPKGETNAKFLTSNPSVILRTLFSVVLLCRRSCHSVLISLRHHRMLCLFPYELAILYHRKCVESQSFCGSCSLKIWVLVSRAVQCDHVLVPRLVSSTPECLAHHLFKVSM